MVNYTLTSEEQKQLKALTEKKEAAIKIEENKEQVLKDIENRDRAVERTIFEKSEDFKREVRHLTELQSIGKMTFSLEVTERAYDYSYYYEWDAQRNPEKLEVLAHLKINNAGFKSYKQGKIIHGEYEVKTSSRGMQVHGPGLDYPGNRYLTNFGSVIRKINTAKNTIMQAEIAAGQKKNKIDTVKEYLSKEFPGAEVKAVSNYHQGYRRPGRGFYQDRMEVDTGVMVLTFFYDINDGEVRVSIEKADFSIMDAVKGEGTLKEQVELLATLKQRLIK